MNTVEFWASRFLEMLGGLGVSLQLTVGALVMGIPLGLLLALGLLGKSKIVYYLCLALVEVGRGAPALVVLYVVYYGLPILSLRPEAMVCAYIGLTYTTAAYTSEYIRGGLKAVSPGSIEAAHALAMPQLDVLRFVLIPQGLRVAIPSLMGFAIQIFQATSLTYSITVREVTAISYSIGSNTFRYLEIFALAGILYAVITIPATWLTNKVEARLALRH
ncbi:MAG: amino acid ABC transporter permease [Propionibacteriaceae bacterium]|jgi:polar amino acid transport system permease protein|nr:amino acid ABC transporter permease [Propionibacteriaceae bacterium]